MGTLGRLEELKTLEHNWDGYGGTTIDHGAIRRCQLFLSLFANPDKHWVYPTPDGGVLVETYIMDGPDNKVNINIQFLPVVNPDGIYLEEENG